VYSLDHKDSDSCHYSSGICHVCLSVHGIRPSLDHSWILNRRQLQQVLVDKRNLHQQHLPLGKLLSLRRRAMPSLVLVHFHRIPVFLHRIDLDLALQQVLIFRNHRSLNTACSRNHHPRAYLHHQLINHFSSPV